LEYQQHSKYPLRDSRYPNIKLIPPGDYVITYGVTDKNSGKSLDINNNVTVQ
jgi:hypothetical protein